MPPRGRARGGRGGTTRASAQAEQPAATESSTPDARSDTVTPAPQSAAPAASSAPARGTTRTMRFKPKAVRRGEEDRLKRAEDFAKIDAAYYREEAKATRSRGRGRGRGRGGFMRGALRASTALGPLSLGMSFGGGSGGGQGSYGSSGYVDNDRINADMLYTVPVDPNRGITVDSQGFERRTRQAPLPMGIRRIEHKEEKLTVANTADIEAKNKGAAASGDDDALFVDQERPATKEPARDEEVWEHSLPKKRAPVKDEDADMMDLDQIPEDKPKVNKGSSSTTEEELLAVDLGNMVRLFTLGEADNDKKDIEATSLEGHMFLFQFPPVLPPLESPTQTADKIKTDPEDDEDDDSSDNTFPQQKKAPVTVDLTEGADKVKTEEGEEASEETQNDNSVLVKEGGFVGNLVVRKSGKVELSWGGQTLLLAPGTQANFLSSAVLLEEGEVKEFSGAAYGMGKIQGSFALVPTWDDEQGWDVASEDLENPDA
ncbi:hypothetical protein OQA88_3349 [Cercophora sp. LCS_1]